MVVTRSLNFIFVLPFRELRNKRGIYVLKTVFHMPVSTTEMFLSRVPPPQREKDQPKRINSTMIQFYLQNMHTIQYDTIQYT